jgi:hypothetical protein
MAMLTTQENLGGRTEATAIPGGGWPEGTRTWPGNGTHAQIDAAVDGACCGEPELAIKLAPSAAGMLVIMNRGFPGVALWRAYTGAGSHLLVRARSCVAGAALAQVVAVGVDERGPVLRGALQPLGPVGAGVALDRVKRQVQAAGAFQQAGTPAEQVVDLPPAL